VAVLPLAPGSTGAGLVAAALGVVASDEFERQFWEDVGVERDGKRS
jgi:hypothetical protein